VLIIKIKMIHLKRGPGILMGAELIDIRLKSGDTQKPVIIQLLMLTVLPVIRKGHNGIPFLLIRLLHLLRRQRPIRNHRMAMQIRFVKIPLFRQ